MTSPRQSRRSDAGSAPPASEPATATTPVDKPFQVSISDQQQAVAVDGDWLVQTTEAVLRDEGVASTELSIAVVDDAAIHDVNREFLNHDYPTDVISFLLNAPDDGDGQETRHIDGEVVISGETATRSAARLGCEPTQELALYLIHGLLHLCGYDDQSAADRQQMRRRERSHLQKLGMTPHYDD